MSPKLVEQPELPYEERIQLAIHQYNSQVLAVDTIRSIARRYGVSYATLTRRIHNGLDHHQATERFQKLNPQEENALAENIRLLFS